MSSAEKRAGAGRRSTLLNSDHPDYTAIVDRDLLIRAARALHRAMRAGHDADVREAAARTYRPDAVADSTIGERLIVGMVADELRRICGLDRDEAEGLAWAAVAPTQQERAALAIIATADSLLGPEAPETLPAHLAGAIMRSMLDEPQAWAAVLVPVLRHAAQEAAA